MSNPFQLLLQQLLDNEPLKSTWYYQDTALAAMEQAVYEAMLFDELFDEFDVSRALRKKGFPISAEKVREQLSYMALEDKEKRLIFREVLLALYDNYRQMLSEPARAAAILQSGLRAIAGEIDESGKIRRYIDDYVYMPKMLLLTIAAKEPEAYGAQQWQKLSQMKPKFAKYYFNCALEIAVTDRAALPGNAQEDSALDVLLEIEKQSQREMAASHKTRSGE